MNGKRLKRTYRGADRCVEINCYKYGTVELRYRGDKIAFIGSYHELPSDAYYSVTHQERYIQINLVLDKPSREQKRRLIESMFDCLRYCREQLK